MVFVVRQNNPSLCGYCISPSMVFVVQGKQSEFLLGVRWSEFRCWNHVESSWGSKTFLWFFRFPEFLDCRSHELAYRAHSTFRPVHPEQVLNNTIIQPIFFSRSHEFTNTWRLLTLTLLRREAVLLFPESSWHLTMWGSRPSHFMIIPNTKGHPINNNTKTDPISEVITITGLPSFLGRTITLLPPESCHYRAVLVFDH